ncbi:hypothetical protein B0H13DRAFT_1881950 [Mycena leptocephala]|nr:hypothetical protein B0H13DRAFT_1881950 [Mycena leptocephala]
MSEIPPGGLDGQLPLAARRGGATAKVARSNTLQAQLTSSMSTRGRGLSSGSSRHPTTALFGRGRGARMGSTYHLDDTGGLDTQPQDLNHTESESSGPLVTESSIPSSPTLDPPNSDVPAAPIVQDRQKITARDHLHPHWYIRCIMYLVAFLHTKHRVTFRAAGIILICVGLIFSLLFGGLVGALAMPRTLKTVFARVMSSSSPIFNHLHSVPNATRMSLGLQSGTMKTTGTIRTLILGKLRVLRSRVNKNENHDYTYFMDEADKSWLDNTNYQRHVEEPIAQETPSGQTDEIFIRVSINEDEFELVMGLFEILTGPKLQQELRDFSFFKPFFLAPLRPDTFASHVVPAWIRPPPVLTSIALTIHPHWQQRRSLRGGHKIYPLLNSEENDYINAAYVCFRNIPIRRTRAQNMKVGKGKVGWLQVDSSAQHLANEIQKLKKASPRRSQSLKPQRAQHIQGRAGKEPLWATPDYKTKVPVGSGVPETATQNGTSNAQPSIKHKISGVRTMKSHTHSHSVTAIEQTGSKEITRPAFEQGRNFDGQNTHYSSHPGPDGCGGFEALKDQDMCRRNVTEMVHSGRGYSRDPSGGQKPVQSLRVLQLSAEVVPVFTAFRGWIATSWHSRTRASPGAAPT